MKLANLSICLVYKRAEQNTIYKKSERKAKQWIQNLNTH